MSSKNLLGRTLKAIYDYWCAHDHAYPTSREIADAVGISINHWGNIRKILFRRKLIKKSNIWHFEFTDVAFEALHANDQLEKVHTKSNKKDVPERSTRHRKNINEILMEQPVIELRLYGVVRAGKGKKPDELIRYSGEETIPIVSREDLDPERLFVMKVEGESMVHDGIYPGDYVIAQETSFARIKNGDLIVATYLSPKFNYRRQDVVDDAREDPNNFEGPALKYFHIDHNGKKEIYYRLSWKTQASQSEFKIYTRYISPYELGKVIAVYTPTRFKKI